MKIKKWLRYFLATIIGIYAIVLIFSAITAINTPIYKISDNDTHLDNNHTYNSTVSHNSYSHRSSGYHSDGYGEDDIEAWFEENGDYYDSAGADYEGYYDDEDYLD